MFLLNSLSRITRGNRSKRHQNLSDASSSSGSFSKKSSTSQLVRTGSPSVEPTALYLQQPFVRTHLVKGNFSTIVSLPRYVDLDEWVALNGMLLCFAVSRQQKNDGGIGYWTSVFKFDPKHCLYHHLPLREDS